jgi:integrase
MDAPRHWHMLGLLFRSLALAMATLIEDPQNRSPFWICVCSASEGEKPRRIWRTTKVRIKPLEGDKHPDGRRVTQRDLKERAGQVCRAIEDSIRLERQGAVTEANLRRILSATLERATGQPLAHPSVATWLEQWIETRAGAIGDRTRLKYVQVKNAFLRSLGRRRDAKLESIGLKDFLDFRNQLLAEGRSPQTADQLVRKVLALPFTLAVKLGLLSMNPLAGLPPLKSTRIEKGVFTGEEISKLIFAASTDWRGAILVGFFTGARLKDVCNLRWANVDLEKRLITFRAGKTGQLITVAIHIELEEHLLSLKSSDDIKAVLFPSLAKRSGGGKSGLSMAFKRIMEKAGVDAGVARVRSGVKGRSFSLRSFHSLRHSFTSALANAGVSQELRQKLTGHASAEMNSLYTHHELETIRQAVSAIPRLLGKSRRFSNELPD